jgi:hypothetical protein
MKKLLIAALLVSGLAYAVWHLVRPPVAADVAAAASATGQSSTSAGAGTSNGSAGPAVAPSAAQPSAARPTPPRPAVVPLKSALAIEFENAKRLKAFYDRYAANPEAASPELKYFAASAMENCVGRGRGTGPSDADRVRFQSKLKENDPNNPLRLAAFERVSQACEGFQSLNLTSADALKLFREAAAAGNPGAKVAVAAEDYREQTRMARGLEERRMSEEQLQTLRESLATGDPFAIQRAGNLLNWQSTQLAERKIGPENDPFNPRDFAPAWTLAACDRGANCGADAYRVLNGCAQQGACGYTNLETYMQYNELAPNVYANAQQYRSMILDAISQGRWDWLGIQQGAGRTVVLPTPEARAPKPPTPGTPQRKIG